MMERDAGPGDIQPILGVYSACIAAGSGYLLFLAPDDELAILAWFRLTPLLACLVAGRDGLVVGVAGLRAADPGPGTGDPGGQWLEASRLAVHPAHRGGAVTRRLGSTKGRHQIGNSSRRRRPISNTAHPGRSF
jgi:hypothetical protein